MSSLASLHQANNIHPNMAKGGADDWKGVRAAFHSAVN